MKALLLKTPEYYFLIVALLAAYSPPIFLNPIFVGIAGIFLLQIIFKNRIAGLVLGSLILLLNLYFLGALLSEFHEFEAMTSGAIQLLSVGIPAWIFNTLFAVVMVFKNIRFDKEAPLQQASFE
jgi:hypothetical protein